MENYIGLKFGVIKERIFCKDFQEKNKKEIEQLNVLYNKLYEKSMSVFSASKNAKSDNNLKNEMCNILDKFYDLGCKIYNSSYNKEYTSKKSYRDYILNYGKEN
nr:MAG TPA: hypothetical protein [Caudoviricetes sp.]